MTFCMIVRQSVTYDHSKLSQSNHEYLLKHGIESVLHQNEGGIGKSIPDTKIISRDPRDIPWASPSGNLLGLGKYLGRRGWISQYLPRFDGARIQSSAL